MDGSLCLAGTFPFLLLKRWKLFLYLIEDAFEIAGGITTPQRRCFGAGFSGPGIVSSRPKTI